MKTNEIINEIKNQFGEDFLGFIGFRKLAYDEVYSIGDYSRPSYDWNYDLDCSSYDTDEPVELNGTSATGTYIEYDSDDLEATIETLMVMNSKSYSGNQIVLFGSRAEHGADENEVIIKDAKVIAIL